MDQFDEEEFWVDIPGYEGLYSASNLSRIKNLRTDKILKPVLNNYLKVTLCKNGETKDKTVHRILALLFIPNPENKRTVNHKNGIKTDIRLCNLEWNTDSENLKHAFAHGLNHSRKGKDNSLSKKIIQLSMEGVPIKTFDSVMDAERELKISNSKIIGVAIGRKYRLTAGGFKWKYLC